MRFITRAVLLFAAISFLSGCCIRFSDINPNTQYYVGSVFSASGTRIAVERFQGPGGNWTTSGRARVDTRNYAFSTGNDMSLSNVNLRFFFDYPVTEITFKYGEYGGNDNMEINGDFRSVSSLATLDGAVIGGVNVAVSTRRLGNALFGDVTLSGNINRFSVGGQDLWIDDICNDKGRCVREWSDAQNLSSNAGESLAQAAAASGNTVHVVWRDDTPGNDEIFYKRSVDGGLTWSAPQNLSSNSGDSVRPSIAVDGDTVYVVWEDDTTGGWNHEIFYKRSPDGGVSWSGVQNLSNSSSASMRPSIAADGVNVHLVWENVHPANYPAVYYMQSTDGGVTWSEAQELFASATSTSLGLKPVAALAGEVLHIAWHDPSTGNFEILYAASADGGLTWSTPQNLSASTGDSAEPAIAADGSDVHLVWHDSTPASPEYEILYKRSVDGGASWGPVQNLSNDPSGSLRPAIAVSWKNVHVAWEQRTAGGTRILYMESVDGGSAWSAPENMAATANGSIPSSPSLATAGGSVHLMWKEYTPVPLNFEIIYKRRDEWCR